MKKAAIIHRERITQYFLDGKETQPTAEQKLLNSIFPFMETKCTEFNTTITEITYNTHRELENKLSTIQQEYSAFIHPSDLIVETL